MYSQADGGKNMKKVWLILLALGLAFNIGMLACSSGDDDSDDDSSSDSDSDGDSDSDSDSDADTDADTDADSDGDCDYECPVNSGYPCPCETAEGSPGCGDGSICGILAETDAYGVCGLACSGAGDAACDVSSLGCAGVGDCVLAVGEDQYCGMQCTTDGDCPSNMICDSSLGSLSICYGAN